MKEKAISLSDVFSAQKGSRLGSIKLYPPVVSKSKSMIHIRIINENLEQEDLEEISSLFSNRFGNLKFEIDYIEPSKDVDIRSLIEEILQVEKSEYILEESSDRHTVKILGNCCNEKIENLSQKCDELGLIIDINKESTDSVDHLDKINQEAKKRAKKLSENNKENIKSNTKKVKTIDQFSHGRKPKNLPDQMKIKNLMVDYQKVLLEGIIFSIDYFEIPNRDLHLITVYFTDYTESTYTKIFVNGDKIDDYSNNLKEGLGISIVGEYTYDSYENSNYIKPSFFELYHVEPIKDLAEKKRIELHTHTSMSAQDGINNPKDIIKRAIDWGHEAIAITDHHVVQAYPELMNASKGKDIKVIYGLEIDMVDDVSPLVVYQSKDNLKYDNFVVFDVETTGFSSREDKIIEIGAIKIIDGEITDKFGVLIDPGRSLDPEIIKLTGITNNQLAGQPTIEEVLPDFKEFIKDSVLVAHNAEFDIGFLNQNFRDCNIDFTNPYIDTLEISRLLNPNVRSHSLGNIAKRIGVSLENAHRAVDDAMATAEIFLHFIKDQLDLDNFDKTLDNINKIKIERKSFKGRTYHANLLAKNLTGLKNLYKLVSISHMEYYYYLPRVPKSILNKYKEGLLIGSSCQDGELQSHIIMNGSDYLLEQKAKFYDYIEIQPIKNNKNLLGDFFGDETGLIDINKKLVSVGNRLNIPVVATGDVHHLDSHDRLSRKVLASSVKGRRSEYDNDYSFLTTNQMLEEFDYLGEQAFDIVVTNTNKISEQIEKIQPIPPGTYPPEIEGSDEDLIKMTMKSAYEIYGEELPNIVKERIDRELDSIIKNNYSVMYTISEKLVSKSIEDGYQVGSRGSVGSSLVATLSGITEVNPLPPHYVCPKCQHSEFIDVGQMGIFSGVDLPEKYCPKCKTKFDQLGDDIPFEVFLGFDGDKEPDIDLNFAGEYQSTAHKYTEELFGEGKVYRAGTIGTIAEKTAYGIVLGYVDEIKEKVVEEGLPPEEILSKAEIERIAKSLIGIRRTTGQHAGGIIIIPDYKDVYDFTPIQYPANASDSGVITTHYDYHAIEESVLKLDILGHDVPTMIRQIEDITGTEFMKTPLNDEDTLEIFRSVDSLNVNPSIFDKKIGTLGIPEFGTDFVQGMLAKTQPKTFSELVQISGLSHGSNVWMGNAEDIVDKGVATLPEVISTREDIMNDLIRAGASNKFSFDTMEKIRRGNVLDKDEEEYISTLDLPSWYIDSLNKISYMFPKAHAVAYVNMSVRLAYYKVHMPEAFYATFLSTKLSNFDIATIINGVDAIQSRINYIRSHPKEVTRKEESDIPIYEIALEILSRDIEFSNIDLYKSEATKFTLDDENRIIPPFRVVPNLGEAVASAIVEERDKGSFISIEDLMKRTGLTKTAVENLKNLGLLSDLSESNQLSFF